MMTLDEAIEHAEWCAENSCGECADDHKQLAEWLKELVALKAENDRLRNELKAIYMCDAYGVKCKDCKNKDLCAYLMREPGIEVE